MNLLLRMAARLEQLLVRAAVLLVGAVLVSQWFLAAAPWQRWWTFANPLDGPPQAQLAWAGVTPLQVSVEVMGGMPAPGAFLLVNGRRAGDFGRGTVTVDVAPGDRLAVDATHSPYPVRFRVVRTAPGIARPPAGLVVRAGPRVVPLGIVEWRRSR